MKNYLIKILILPFADSGVQLKVVILLGEKGKRSILLSLNNFSVKVSTFNY